MLLQAVSGDSGTKSSADEARNGAPQTGPDHAQMPVHIPDYSPAPGWTMHATKEGRLFYCNHITRTAGWLPPAEAWKCGENGLPYGWERALDESGRPYYINHLNKTTTYETPMVKSYEPSSLPEPRVVSLERSPVLGFGFVAGSEKPVIVRFVTEDGPSVDKLLPGDQILSVNGEDVKMAPREHVISLVRACTKTVNLVVCQPPEQQGVRKSTLLSASKRARLKNKPSRVRFAESVCVNGAPLFPPSAFSLGDLCVAPMANVLKVFLENGQTKSFKYDAWTTVHDVVTSLETKLCLQAREHFSLVVEHIKSVKRNKLTLLDPSDTLARIASRPGAHKLRCLFRVAFVPQSPAELAQRDLNAFDYLYIQCCNDVIQERFAPELQYDTALRLAALHIYQHALTNNIVVSKLTVKAIERDFGLERFVPASLLENMKRKEVRKLVAHFLKLHLSMMGPGKQLTVLQAKLHYLDIVSQLPSYGAKCFSAGPRGDVMERVILVSPKFGISQITGTRNSVPVPITNIEDMRTIEVRSDDEVTRTVLIWLHGDKAVSVSMEERDASELVLVLRGYFRLATGQILPVDREEAAQMEDLAPPYLSQHRVIPEKWSYANQAAMKTACFAAPPSYQTLNKKTNGLYNTVGRQSKPPLIYGYSVDNNMNNSLANRNHQFKHQDSETNNYHQLKRNSFDNNSFNFQNVVSSEMMNSGAAGSRNDDVLKRVKEMHQLVKNSENYLTEQENLERFNGAFAEWQETSVDIGSDTDSMLIEDAPGILKHSDSLLLLNKCHNFASDSKHASFTNAAIEMLRSEVNQSESDNDSLYTPHNSPDHNKRHNNVDDDDDSKANRFSFGLCSPTHTGNKNLFDFKSLNGSDRESLDSIYIFDADLIDLTLLPPPATPDELDCALPTPLNLPPSSFADSIERLNMLGEALSMGNSDLEAFLASVTVPPPIQKATPATELTSEEIMSYIIPPPPKSDLLTVIGMPPSNNGVIASTPTRRISLESDTARHQTNTTHNSNNSANNVIEYATVDRKGPFSCCAKGKRDKSPNKGGDTATAAHIQPFPRRSLHETPPERPPKHNLPPERSRSHSLTSATVTTSRPGEFPPPKLPPRGDKAHQTAAPHLFLPPKKPPLPPVPPLEVLRQKKNVIMSMSSAQQPKPNPDNVKTAGIGSPHLQRNRNMCYDLDTNYVNQEEEKKLLGARQVATTAVSTPTTPHIGKNAPLTAIPISTPTTPTFPPIGAAQDSPPLPSSAPPEIVKTANYYPFVQEPQPPHPQPQHNVCYNNLQRNGCISNRENLLVKTGIAMAGLLARLDQIAAQCHAAQTHGGGRLINEEKFQVAKEELTSQSLQLVNSSKMLVIAMSDPSLPDLPENLAVCLTILRRLTELSQDLTNHTTAPLQTRNLILKVHDVTAAFRHLVVSDMDRSSLHKIEEHLAAQAERLANVLATLLRSLRVFSP